MREKIIVEIPKKFITILSTEKLKEICLEIFKNDDFIIHEESRSIGNYIKLFYNKKVVYIVLTSPKADGRNAYLAQYVPTVYNEYYYDTSTNKEIFVYLLDTTIDAKTDYHNFIYRSLLTLNIRILNIKKLGISLHSFSDYSDFRNTRKIMQKNNNNSTFFEETDEYINFYGKVFGANGKESTLLCLVVSKLSSKPIKFFQVLDNKTNNLSGTDIKLLKSHNILISEELIENYTNTISIKGKDMQSLRDTPKFHYNLFKKFGDKKCYLCDCEIEKLIIGAHIHRVTDIEKDKTLNDIEKGVQIVDKDNGFRLCANHDKLFEWGLVYFEKERLIINEILLASEQVDFINKITDTYLISETHYNENLEGYLEKHKHRIFKTN